MQEPLEPLEPVEPLIGSGPPGAAADPRGPLGDEGLLGDEGADVDVESFSPAALPPDQLMAYGDPGAVAPLREIAQAFRMNAEALHTLKQMQADLAHSVKRGDRSELVLQSTRSLNDTFRNLTSVQRELLTRLDGKPAGGGRGPLIPLLLLGLLVVLLGSVYVILGAVEETGARDPEFDPVAIAHRERDSYKEGRKEGGLQAEREIQRQREALEEAKARSRKLQAALDAKEGELRNLDLGRRSAEIERDEFASQVRKAQGEMMAKKVLEDEVASLRRQRDEATQGVQGLQHALDLKHRTNAWLRQRLADYGMGFLDDDPAWSPDAPAGAQPTMVSVPGKKILPNLKLPGDGASPEAPLSEAQRRLELLKAGRRKMGLPTDDLEVDGPSSVPPPATPIARPTAANAAHAPTLSAPRQPQPAVGAAYGGDGPGALPPPMLPGRRAPQQGLPRRDGLERNPAHVERVRARINELLDASGPSGRAGWELTRIDGVAQNRVGGVVLLYHDARGQLLESIEARDLSISVDRERNTVEFSLREGSRVSKNKRTPLPARGMRIVVAEGKQAGAWKRSSLSMVRER